MRVFLDTNVLVSAVATRGLCSDLLRVVLSEHELLVGESVLNELGRILRDKLHVPAEISEETEAFLRREASVSADAATLELSLRDPNDAEVLAQAMAAKAEVFVTGDRDLLDVASEAPLPILSPRCFWDRIRARPITPDRSLRSSASNVD